MENQYSLQTRHSTKLQDRSKFEKPNSSYADLKSKILKNKDNVSPSFSRNHQKLRIERKSVESEEIVKCMSSLPSFLERGENLQENAFNVGVLDWRQLEKWQSNNRKIPYCSSRYSQSSSNTSSYFSTDGSSTHSSIGRSFSPARQRMHRPTLLAHLKASPNEVYSHSIKGDDGKFQDLQPASSKSLKGQQSMLRTYQSFNKHHYKFKLKERERRDLGSQVVHELKNSREFGNCGSPSLFKGKMKIQDDESTKGRTKLQEPYYKVVDHNCSERSKSKDSSAISYLSDSISVNGLRSAEASRRSFAEGSFSEGTYHSKLNSDIPYSCPLPCDIESIKNSQTKQPNSTDSKSFKSSSEPLHRFAKRSIGPPKIKNVEEKKSTTAPTNPIVIKPAKGPDLSKDTVVVAKVRNPSPTRRFSIGLGRIGRSSSSKDGSVGAVAPAILDKSTSDKSNAAIRVPSSPLRRLLDPLLKPKAANSHRCVDPSQKESLNAHSVEGKLDLGSCRKINFDDSHHNEKSGSSKVQAFLQIAIKNGLPLFTFAVGSEILAATMRNLRTSEKDGNGWIFTFITVHEVKKKNGWINQGGKGKGHGFIPNVVAQMKVSESQFSKSTRHNSTDQFSIREFVLFAVDLRQADQQTSDLQPTDELAAIVVKLPKETSRGLNQDGLESNNFNCRSPIGLKEPLPERRGYFNSRDYEKNGSFVRAHDLFTTTVVLPGGVHGLPSKGEPSPLLERWKSGGLCDCGGWDMGCIIRVLANQTQLGGRVTSSKLHPTTGQFELFSQGEVLDDRPVFSISPFDDEIFSVEFGSSLTHLQAFSICIAILNCGKSFELSELNKLFEESF